MKYVALDIGCIECGETSTILGIFDDKGKAEETIEKYEEIQNKNWTGQHNFEVIKIENENTELYTKKTYLERIRW